MEVSAHVEDALNLAFGTHTVHNWPGILPAAPRWWQRRRRRQEARVNAALATIGRGRVTDRMRQLYWREVRRGQDIYEDAGGYCLRCWWAALELPYRPHQEGYDAAIDRLMGSTHSPAIPTGEV